MTVDGTGEILAKQTKLHQCCCIVANERCNNKVPMDVPFCFNCEDRHPQNDPVTLPVSQEL